MRAAEGLQARLDAVQQVIDAPPLVHPNAPNGAVWRTSRDCYDFMAGQVGEGSRTLETGAGVSTVLFALWGCAHTAVVPFAREAEAIAAHCRATGVDTSLLSFDVRPSEVALPGLADAGPLDLVFIDGSHGFPMPVVDWFYGAGRLGLGGVVVFDDAQLPQVAWLLDGYLERDDRWERLAATWKWRAYRRRSEGPLAESESKQPVFAPLAADPWTRLATRAKDAVPPPLRRRMAAVRDRLTRAGR